VPFDALSVLTVDPATGLATGAYVEHGLAGDAAVRIAEIEYREPDVNKFAELASSGRVAAALSQATRGDLSRSRRHRELRAPRGFGDELRAVFVQDAATWGAITLGRASDRASFSDSEVDFVASLSGQLADGARRALLAHEIEAAEGAPGLAQLEADRGVVSADEAATRWLAELQGPGGSALPPVVVAVASRARSIATEGGAAKAGARARVRTRSGSWLVVGGSALDADLDSPVAVTLGPARQGDLAPLIADAYELTERERLITQLVAEGLSTELIGRRLYISPWTVQDHLKAVFEKVGVSSRGELVARIYFDHGAPRLAEPSPQEPMDRT
jgi:DNA-binding CsgD family transcriptional regulator